VSVVALGVMITIAGVLTVSAAAKAAHPGPAAQALVQLGLSRRFAPALVGLGVAVETLVAAAIVVWPREGAAQLGCLALFGTFAALAVLAIVRNQELECGCFGTVYHSRLGWTQLVQFAVVSFGLATLVAFAPSLSVRNGLAVLLIAQLAACAFLLASLVPAWWQVRRDRVSLSSYRAYARELGLAAAEPHPESVPR
jgi:Methylamine utilisation protein MauE